MLSGLRMLRAALRDFARALARGLRAGTALSGSRVESASRPVAKVAAGFAGAVLRLTVARRRGFHSTALHLLPRAVATGLMRGIVAAEGLAVLRAGQTLLSELLAAARVAIRHVAAEVRIVAPRVAVGVDLPVDV